MTARDRPHGGDSSYGRPPPGLPAKLAASSRGRRASGGGAPDLRCTPRLPNVLRARPNQRWVSPGLTLGSPSTTGEPRVARRFQHCRRGTAALQRIGLTLPSRDADGNALDEVDRPERQTTVRKDSLTSPHRAATLGDMERKRIELGIPGSESATAFLTYDNWDDYTYKTMMHVEIALPDGTTHEIGQVKLVQAGQADHTKTWDRLPATLTVLDESWASLGQSEDYYRSLMLLAKSVRERYLSSIRDAAWNPAISERFEEEPAWNISVLRFGQAAEALSTARQLFGSAPRESTHPRFTAFLPALRSEDYSPGIELSFDFNQTTRPETRICALIGYNGSGKTTSLARIAELAHADAQELEDSDFLGRVGSFIGARPGFSGVTMASYSAFDTFELPRERR